MPTPKWGKMVESILPEFRCLFEYAVCNKISDEGCRHLSGAKWQNLSSLNLGIHVDMEGETTLAMMDADI